MPRPKAFDPDEALAQAIACFRRLGFAGASVGDLTAAMGIGRQSLYATYGDKRALFLHALAWYGNRIASRYVAGLDREGPPLRAIAAVLHEIARFAASAEGVDGCLITNSAADLGARDAEIRAVVVATYARIEEAFCRALQRAQRDGSLPPDRDPRALARFCVTFLQGLRVVGATRPDPTRLHADVEAALRCLA